jgi:hypothetical protein
VRKKKMAMNALDNILSKRSENNPITDPPFDAMVVPVIYGLCTRVERMVDNTRMQPSGP